MATAKGRGKLPKGKPRGKPFTGVDDPRRSRAGRPSNTLSWAGTLRHIQSMTPEEIVEWVTGPLANEYRKMPKGVTMKQIITLRWLASQVNEPTIGLIKEIIDRTDGPVPVEIRDWRDEARQAGIDADAVFEQLINAAMDRASEGGSVAGSAAPPESEGSAPA